MSLFFASFPVIAPIHCNALSKLFCKFTLHMIKRKTSGGLPSMPAVPLSQTIAVHCLPLFRLPSYDSVERCRAVALSQWLSEV